MYIKIMFLWLFALIGVGSTTVLATKNTLHPYNDTVQTLPPCTDLITTFFNQQQFAWGFGLLNTTNSAVNNWEVRITNANYQLDPAQLSNQSAFVYSEIVNLDGTFDLILTGTSSIAPFSSIPGGNIQWPGVNFGNSINSDGISIFCGELTATVITNRRITYRVKGN